MASSPLGFNKNFSDLAEQAVYKGKPVSSGTLGPYVAVGPSQSNPWMSAYAKQPDAAGFSQQGFPDDSADQALNTIKSFGDGPSDTSFAFSDKNSFNRGAGFLGKYMVDNGLVPQDQKITRGSIAGIQAQQPAQLNPPGTLAAGTMSYPGASGTKIG